MRLIYVAIGWTIGILIASAYPRIASQWWLVMALGFCLLTWVNRANYTWRWVFISLVALAIGGARYASLPQTSDIARYNQGGGITVIGEVVALPDISDTRQQVRLNAIQVVRGANVFATSGLVMVVARPLDDIRYGDVVAVTGELLAPQTFDTFSYADFLGRQEIFSVMENVSIQVYSRGGGSPIIHALADIRAGVSNIIMTSIPEPASGFLIGILLGDRQHISPELDDDFRATGASHLLAISGFNMVIIAGVVQGILTWLLPNRRWWVLGIALVIIGIYTALTGANASVLRAALMTAVLLIGQTLRRNTYVPTSLAFVTLLMSFITPTLFWDVRFQLSFAAVLGLSLFVTPLQRIFQSGVAHIVPQSRGRMLVNWLTEPLIVSVAAQITTTPIILANFGRFSVVTLPVNFLIIPTHAYLLVMGMVSVGVFFLPMVSQLLFWLTLIFASWTLTVVRLFASLPFADMEWRLDPRLVLLFYICLIGGMLMNATQPNFWRISIGIIRSRVAQSISLFGVFGILLLMSGSISSRPDGRLHVWYLTMGHQNAVLMQTPGGAHILIDGGRYPSRLLTALGDRLPFYDQTIEILILTHPDDADTQAVISVLERYDVGVVISHGQGGLTDTQLAIADKLQLTPHAIVQAGYTTTLSDGTLIEVLHPTLQPVFGASLENNMLVIRVTYGEVSFLFTSDLSRQAQADMLASGIYPQATVLQLPQHGGARSLDGGFLRAVAPSLVVIQADPANRLGDPHGDILTIVGDIPTWRTDELGTIHLWTDGVQLWGVGEK